MKKRRFFAARRFLRRFNPWLFLVCILLAAVIWCAAVYIEAAGGLFTAAVSSLPIAL